MKIKIYTVQTCHACKELIRQCRESGVKFQEVVNEKEVLKAAKLYSFKQVPFVVIETGNHFRAADGFTDSRKLIEENIPGRKL